MSETQEGMELDFKATVLGGDTRAAISLLANRLEFIAFGCTFAAMNINNGAPDPVDVLHAAGDMIQDLARDLEIMAEDIEMNYTENKLYDEIQRLKKIKAEA